MVGVRTAAVGIAAVGFTLGCGGMLVPDDAELGACAAYIDSGSMPVWSPEQVLNGNIDALNDETVECYMGVFHADSPQILGTYAMTQQLYEQYDLQASFAGPLTVNTLPNGDAEVRFVQETRNTNGEPFNENRATGVHLMRKNDQGRWRLISTEIQSAVPLP